MRKFLYSLLGRSIIGLLVWGFTFLLKIITKSENPVSWTIGTWAILIVAVVVTIAMIIIVGVLWEKVTSSPPPPPPPAPPHRRHGVGVWIGRIIGVIIIVAGTVYLVKLHNHFNTSRTTWVYKWYKDPDVGGENPAQRSGGPFLVKFERADQDEIIFNVYDKGLKAAHIKLWRSGESGFQWVGRYHEFVYNESANARFDQKPDGSLVGQVSTVNSKWINVEVIKR